MHSISKDRPGSHLYTHTHTVEKFFIFRNSIRISYAFIFGAGSPGDLAADAAHFVGVVQLVSLCAHSAVV